MIDKNLTNNEIIKALEDWIKNYDGSYVNFKILGNALDLITRQQAEYENLKVENQSLRSAANSLKMNYEEAQAEVDKLNTENMLTMSERNAFQTSFNEASKRLKSQKHALFEQQSYTADLQKQLKTAKSEAYKECIEKIKGELKNLAKIDWQDNYCYLVGTAFFDNILDNLVDENNRSDTNDR